MSSNIVGYEKIEVPQNTMDIVGVQFKAVGGADNFVDLQDITVEGYGEEGTDWIKVYDPDTSKYTTVYYYGEAMEGVYTDDTYETCLGPGWGDDDQIAVDMTIDAGQGVWTKTEAANARLVVSGEVVSNTEVSVPENTMTIVANPLPMAVNIQQISVDGYGEEGTDWIKVYDPDTSKYTTVYYYGAAMEGVYTDDTYETCLGPGWGDDDQVAVDLNIKVGQGFWTKTEAANAKLVFPEVNAE